MNRIFGPLLAAATLTFALPASAAIEIVFDYTYDTGVFFDAGRKSVLEAAAAVFESRITDALEAITSGGGNSFDAMFEAPDSGVDTTLSSYSIAADHIVIFVGGRTLAGPLGMGGPGGLGAGGTLEFVNTVQARGQLGALLPTATDFGPWGGSIVFDSATDWYFDTDPASFELFTGFDFYSVALHEIGHVLGVGTAASWDALIDAGAGTFTGGNSMGDQGGAPVPLFDSGHWAEGTLSTVLGVPQEAAMDPTLNAGARKHFTELDWDGLQDLGWEIAPVPEIETWAMLLVGLGLVGFRAHRRST